MGTQDSNETRRQKVRIQVMSCTACPLHKIATRPVPFSGKCPSYIAIIGEAPGKEEDVKGVPFVGRSGTLIRQLLGQFRFPFSNIAWLNAVSCYPNGTPQQSSVKACRGNLWLQLRAIRPTYGLVLGGIALGSIHPGLKITEHHGKWFKEGGIWFMATYHPAAVLRDPRLKRTVIEDLDLFNKVAIEKLPLIPLFEIQEEQLLLPETAVYVRDTLPL